MSVKKRLFDLKSRTVKRHVGRYLDELIRAESLSPQALLDVQATKARQIAELAAAHSPYYVDRFREHGIDASQADDPEVWQTIPIIGREDVKAATERMKTPEANPKTTRLGKTSGSTGQPLQTLQDARVPILALAWRNYRWWGVQPWDNLARVGRWGFSRLDSLKNDVSWWPTRQVHMDAGLLNTAAMAGFHRRLVTTRPALIEGYVGAMVEFADYLSSNHVTIPGLRAVSTTAAPLTSSVRGILETAFGVPVYDEYRGSEVNWMAGECRERNGLHVYADARLIEVVDATGRRLPPGVEGEIAVTDLTNRVFPIIRYKNGDRGMLLEGDCPCGLPFPRIASPSGRTVDTIRTPSGKAINGGLTTLFSTHPESVRLFQIHQAADFSIRILVVRGDEVDAEAHIRAAVEGLRTRLKHEVPVDVEYVDSLPSTRGKLKYIFSDAPAPDRSVPGN